MEYLLDTNILSDLIRNPAGKVAVNIALVGEEAVCTSIVVAAELRYGCAKKGSSRLTRKVDDLLKEIPVLPFDQPSDATYGVIRAALETAGASIGHNDLLIAAQGSALGKTIVTGNVREFSRVRGLKVINWLD
jgi:tRNA(fMet)-specific endonuclease VapC